MCSPFPRTCASANSRPDSASVSAVLAADPVPPSVQVVRALSLDRVSVRIAHAERNSVGRIGFGSLTMVQRTLATLWGRTTTLNASLPSSVVRCLRGRRRACRQWPWGRRDLRWTSLPSSILVIVSLGASSRFLVDRLSRSTLGLWIGKRSARGHQQIAKSERIVLSSTSTARRSA